MMQEEEEEKVSEPRKPARCQPHLISIASIIRQRQRSDNCLLAGHQAYIKSAIKVLHILSPPFTCHFSSSCFVLSRSVKPGMHRHQARRAQHPRGNSGWLVVGWGQTDRSGRRRVTAGHNGQGPVSGGERIGRRDVSGTEWGRKG